jgi:CubicO group peptidase (beta-lactamase class C family)
MTTPHLLEGFVDPRLHSVIEPLRVAVEGDPDLSVQVAAYHRGDVVLDVWAGPHLCEDSVMVPYSVTKCTIGIVAGLLLQRGLLDLDEPVATYCPEFAEAGKHHITVRMLLSHQAGLPQVLPPLTFEELFHDHAAAARLALAPPLWYPGSAFGYHAMTIGSLASELVYRITGRTIQDFYEEEVRAPYDIEFFLGLPESDAHRLVPVLPLIEPTSAPGTVPRATAFGAIIFQDPGPGIERIGTDPAAWRFGHPAAAGTASARGMAKLMAVAISAVGGVGPLLSPGTVATIGQQQVHGYDEVLGQGDRAHAVVFQKPTITMDFGSARAFGHDGAQGCFAAIDPDSDLAFGYVVARGPWPGGADPRAISLMRALSDRLRATP